jgi:DNA-directed RNA polymerase specialized sigma24 family protein
MSLANAHRRLVSSSQNGAFPYMLRGLRIASGRRKGHDEKERSFDGGWESRALGLCEAAPGAACPRSAGRRLEAAVYDVSGSRAGRKASGLTQEAFDSLLDFLGDTPEAAGRRYEEIRRRLTKIFACRGCATPEELVDESIDRVARKAAELAPTYDGDPALYFYGVARRVYLESVKRKPAAPPPPEPDSIVELEPELDCLDACMEALSPEQSALIRDYYREDKSAKIEHRKALAERMGIGINALRIRAHRIRAELQRCVSTCLERREDGALSPDA